MTYHHISYSCIVKDPKTSPLKTQIFTMLCFLSSDRRHSASGCSDWVSHRQKTGCHWACSHFKTREGGSTFKLTQVVVSRIQTLWSFDWRPSSVSFHLVLCTIWQLLFLTGSKGESKREWIRQNALSICNFGSQVVFHHFCHGQLVRNRSLSLYDTQGKIT